MGAVIGEILPLAVGVAVSPIPIIAAILMLFSERAGSTSSGFLIGWILGIVVATAIFTRWRAHCIPGASRRPWHRGSRSASVCCCCSSGLASGAGAAGTTTLRSG
jgi:hypothetical protein